MPTLEMMWARDARIAKLEGQLADMTRKQSEFEDWAASKMVDVSRVGADEGRPPTLHNSWIIDADRGGGRGRFRYISPPGYHILWALRQAFDAARETSDE